MCRESESVRNNADWDVAPRVPLALVSRTLLGVVVLDPGEPGRREGVRGFSAPIPREGPRGLTLGVLGAAGLGPEGRCTWSPRLCRSQPAPERGRERQGRFRSGWF